MSTNPSDWRTNHRDYPTSYDNPYQSPTPERRSSDENFLTFLFYLWVSTGTCAVLWEVGYSLYTAQEDMLTSCLPATIWVVFSITIIPFIAFLRDQ